MRGERGTADFGLHIYRRSGLVDFELYEAEATLTEEISIRLYKNTNACFVQVYYYDYKHPYDFLGYIYPAGVLKQPVFPRATFPGKMKVPNRRTSLLSA